ncbi:hypothetical protein BJV74DRAFT_475833 [Russula compacta]|nr:hypothetical protein BJV74DRAFT_475833 [Russula compacta]
MVNHLPNGMANSFSLSPRRYVAPPCVSPARGVQSRLSLHCASRKMYNGRADMERRARAAKAPRRSQKLLNQAEQFLATMLPVKPTDVLRALVCRLGRHKLPPHQLRKCSCRVLVILTRNPSLLSCPLPKYLSTKKASRHRPLDNPVNMNMNAHHIIPLSHLFITVPAAGPGWLILMTLVSMGATGSTSSAMRGTTVRGMPVYASDPHYKPRAAANTAHGALALVSFRTRIRQGGQISSLVLL